MKAVILAAGDSKRLRPYLNTMPKCLIPIGGKSILDHQLDAIRLAGIGGVVIVIGYRRQMIIDSVDRRRADFKSISFVVNREYESTNTIYSLYLAREEFRNHDFIYFNADVLMHHDIVRMLVEHSGSNVLAVDYVSCGEEEVKFVIDDRGLVTGLGKDIPQDKAEGEFIGVAKFGRGISDSLIDALGRYVREEHKNLFFEKAVEDILHREGFHPLDVSHIPNIEIDFPEDLERAKNQIYPAIIEYDAISRTSR